MVSNTIPGIIGNPPLLTMTTARPPKSNNGVVIFFARNSGRFRSLKKYHSYRTMLAMTSVNQKRW
jgi:hypothetical protein